MFESRYRVDVTKEEIDEAIIRSCKYSYDQLRDELEVHCSREMVKADDEVIVKLLEKLVDKQEEKM